MEQMDGFLGLLAMLWIYNSGKKICEWESNID